MRGQRDGHARVDARDLLDGQRVGEVAGPAAAVLLGVGDAHQAELAELLHDLVGEAVLAVKVLGHRLHLAVREVAGQLLDLALLVGEIEDHGAAMVLIVTFVAHV